MLFSILVILAVAAITFVHYLQGFFSATISAILAIFAAILAFSLHEQIAEAFLIKNAIIPTMADAVTLIALFALFYVILRVIFDKAVPGNLQIPAGIDKVGGAVMGIVAAIFATGIFAIA